MSLDDFTKLEDDRMKFNVFLTCKDLVGRIQDPPGPRRSLDPMSGYVSEHLDEQFFSDTNFLTAYLSVATTKRNELPGHG